MLNYRLFIHNLFICTKYDIGHFWSEITDITCHIIQVLVNDAREMLLNEEISLNGRDSVLPNSFIRFVQDQTTRLKLDESSKTGRAKKMQDYILFQYFKNIEETVKHIMYTIDKIHKGNRKAEISQSEIDILKQFQENEKYLSCNYDVGPISQKNLERLLDIEKLQYSKHQQKFIIFLLEEVFPVINEKTDGEFLDNIKKNNWYTMLFIDLETNKRIDPDEKSPYLPDDVKPPFEIEDINDKNIRQKLIEAYKKLPMIYQSLLNKKISEKKHNNPIKISYSEKSENQALLSSHIVRFMQWIPILPDDDLPFYIMESVSNIMDRIENQINFEELSDTDNLFLEKMPLRKQLIQAMYYEPNIRSQFIQYFNDKNGNEGY